jgi:uncharacterized protein DUF6458
MKTMGIAVSLLLIAFGAILTWAVKREVSGLDIDVVGVILMAVGLVGLVLSLIWWQSWGGFRRRRYVEDDRGRYVEGDPRYVEGDPRYDYPATRPRRRVVEEEDVPAGPPPP